ncbi:hypothetical protein H2198_009894 [Neophaeococcomyces mojaviensis]|uniref:Uncharacterized protein n=1 Tax=Neophaeococcomyces mojaviensis TaxID=3383035 RepID=A0ACC2ZT30_9EURO|nr:hypothetical protein H2198_009894 [Knufia sp. JES_112]
MSARQSLSRNAKSNAKPIQSLDLSDLEADDRLSTAPRDFYDDDISGLSDQELDRRKRKSSTKHKARGGKKQKLSKTAKTKTTKSKPPPPPEMSDSESEEEREEELRLFDERRKLNSIPQVKARLLPATLKLEVRSTPTTIHINLGDLFSKYLLPTQTQAVDPALDGRLLLGDDSSLDSFAKSQIPGQASYIKDIADMRLNHEYASFLELEPDLRNRIYRDILVSDNVVEFDPPRNLSRTAALLRTCRQVYNEARGILYGENAFHFGRNHKERASYFKEGSKEIGYKAERRFLEHIGPDNIACLRFLSIDFCDALPSSTPTLETAERRYTNDPILCHILKLIGTSGVVLDKFVVGFAGKAEVSLEDVNFIRALTSIKCHTLRKTCKFGHSKVAVNLWSKLEDFMQVPRAENIDISRRKQPRMKNARLTYGCAFCAFKKRRAWWLGNDHFGYDSAEDSD